jgi:tol-pal system protein YbgF
VADNTTRVNDVMTELTSMRTGFKLVTDQLNTLVNLLQPPTNPSADGSIGTPAPGSTGSLAPVALGDSPTKVYNAAMGDYMSSHYDNAVDGFTEYINKFPTSPNAADAQFFIGESYYQPGKFKEAVAAYDKLVKTYPNNERVPEAYYKQALSYIRLNQKTQAITILHLIIKTFPDDPNALQAQQELNTLGVK